MFKERKIGDWNIFVAFTKQVNESHTKTLHQNYQGFWMRIRRIYDCVYAPTSHFLWPNSCKSLKFHQLKSMQW